MSPLALEIHDLHAWYGESHVLHGINLAVHKGEVVCYSVEMAQVALRL